MKTFLLLRGMTMMIGRNSLVCKTTETGAVPDTHDKYRERISGEKLNQPFAFDQQTQYQPITKEISVKNNTLSCTFPPHSFTQIKLGVK